MWELISAAGQNKILVSVVAPVVMLGVLIFVHELGHFLVAKLFGVGVLQFSFGFGPRIFGLERNGTEYRVAWIPLGGYVKMLGDDPFELEERGGETEPGHFLSKPVWQRLLVVLAGPAFNLILPIFVFAALWIVGKPEPTTLVGMIEPGSPAAQAGIREGELVTSINGQPVRFEHDLAELLEAVPLGAEVEVTLSSNGTERRLKIPLKVEQTRNELGSPISKNLLGVSPIAARPLVGVLDSSLSPSRVAGLKTGDRIVRINGQAVDWWFQVEPLLVAQRGKALELELLRDQAPVKARVESGGPALLDSLQRTAPAGFNVADLLARMPSLEWGIMPGELVLGEVVPGKPASLAGLLVNDLVVAVNGQPLTRWMDLSKRVQTPVDELKTLVVVRGAELKQFEVQPEVFTYRDAMGDVQKQGRVFIAPQRVLELDKAIYQLGVGAALAAGAEETGLWIVRMLMAMGKVLSGGVPLTESLGGPITIVTLAAQSAWISIFQFMDMLVMLSINLGLINLLPIPLLDGGHILFFSIELLRGRPVNNRFREVSQQVGFLILFVLMVFAFANDLRMHVLP